MQSAALSVRQLNLYVRSLLEGDIRLNDVTVTGELSNFKNHYSSGHLYFTLKDKDAAIRCVMFRAYASKIRFVPEDGMQVILRGKVSVYEKDGQYQLYAEEMLAAGLGDLALQFEKTKAKLEAEGLFDAESKRKLPQYPSNIGVVTSDTGAAVQDIINIISRRWSVAKIIMCPVAVQGELAVASMLDALDRLYKTGVPDVIIIGRGGGSAEDLAAFNDEALARKIYESPVPIISAVGHETDFSISDFVADLRAPTPSAAAELAVPDVVELSNRLNRYETVMSNLLNAKYKLAEMRLTKCISAMCIKNPVGWVIDSRTQQTDRLYDRLRDLLEIKIRESELKFTKTVSALEALSPLKTLTRGFVAVSKDGVAIDSVSDTAEGDLLDLRFADGVALCEVKQLSKYKD